MYFFLEFYVSYVKGNIKYYPLTLQFLLSAFELSDIQKF